jgi:hypothetical protein
MVYRRWIAASMLVVSCVAASAKDKKKTTLPDDILQARTVLVVVDPEAGMAIDNPNANRTALDAVEKALLKWGRFSLVVDASNADLIVTVSKGSGKLVTPSIGGVPVNNRPVILQPTDSGGRIGGRAGTPPTPGDPSASQSSSEGPRPQAEIGSDQDMFVVYRGNRDNPLDYPAVWRFRAKNALQSPGVPAVKEFHDAIAEAEKKKAANP